MTDNESNVKSRIGLPSDAYRLGIDARGMEHWHSVHQSRIWLVDGDDVDTRDLGDVPASAWVDQVESHIGEWQEVQPVDERDGFAGIARDVCKRVA
jgi:hypothetical protein